MCGNPNVRKVMAARVRTLNGTPPPPKGSADSLGPTAKSAEAPASATPMLRRRREGAGLLGGMR